MSVKSYKSCILLYTFFVIASSLGLGYASPTTAIVKDDPIIESLEEINDLNKNIILRDSSIETSEPTYTHRDQDTIDNDRLTTILGKLKNDVEILEANDSEQPKDDSEIEERYRGPSIVINTNEFINENIEMNAEDDAEAEERADQKALATTHMILSIILVVVVLVSIGLYAALVMWRSHIEQRYGMRELLVTSDNQDYWPQHLTDTAAIPAHIQAQQHLEQQQSA